MAVSILLSLCSVYVSAADSLDIETMEKIKLKREPCFGDYEIIPNEVDVLASNPDVHESNNSFLEATILHDSPESSNENNLGYSETIYGTIHQETWLFGLFKKDVDEDYYRFDIFGEAIVEITLDDIPLYCDYDIELWQFKNIKNAKKNDIEMIDDSFQPGVNAENITLILQPGTYYVWVYSYNESFDESKSYSLSVDVDYTVQNASISGMRSNGATAAIWVSDYDPFGIEPLTLMTKESVGFQNYSGFNQINYFANPYFDNFFQAERISHVELYVWGSATRNELFDLLEEYIDTINQSIEGDRKIKAWLNFGSMIGNVVDLTLNFVDIDAGVSYMYSSTTGIGGSLIQALFPVDEWIATKSDVILYFRTLQAALEAIEGVSSDQEVVRISVSYSLIEIAYDSRWDYWIDFTPAAITNRYLYSGDTIYGASELSFTNGKIYSIIDGQDIDNALNRFD